MKLQRFADLALQGPARDPRDVIHRKNAGKEPQPAIFRNGSYMYKGVFVEPGPERAAYVESGESLPFSSFAKITEEAARRLRYSDLILEKNLIKSVLRK